VYLKLLDSQTLTTEHLSVLAQDELAVVDKAATEWWNP
jgi:hypothetical protein